ncbi:MAG: STAS domain-containing protein [Bacteroidota bacterium]
MSTEEKERFQLEIERESSITIAHLKGRLDTYSSDEFSSRFDELLDGTEHLILVMSDLIYVSSAGLRALYNLNARMDEHGQLIFCELHHNVDRMFEIVDVKSMFQIYEDEQTAREALDR